MTPSLPRLSLFLAVLLVSAVGRADAETIYRWVDKQGKTHYSGVVPSEYKSSAKPLEQAVKPSQEERQRAIALAEKQKAEVDRMSRAVAGEGAEPLATKPEKSIGIEKRPAKAPAADADCETWQRLFQESGECFAPFKVAGGGTKKEAF